MWEDDGSLVTDEEGAAGGESLVAGKMTAAVFRQAVAVMPGDGESLAGQVGAGKLVFHDVLGRPYLVVHAGMIGALDISGSTCDSEGREYRIQYMAPEIAEGSVPEVLPVAPTPRVVDLSLDVRSFRSYPEPDVPS